MPINTSSRRDPFAKNHLNKNIPYNRKLLNLLGLGIGVFILDIYRGVIVFLIRSLTIHLP